MRNNKFKKLFSCILGGMLIAALTLTTGCTDNNELPKNPDTNQTTTVLGEGETTFYFEVHANDTITKYEIHTNQTNVGDALVELNLIEGEESEYGLFIKKVTGIEADYDKDKTYWAFYINDEYAMSGVDTTDIIENDTYSLKKEK